MCLSHWDTGVLLSKLQGLGVRRARMGTSPLKHTASTLEWNAGILFLVWSRIGSG